GFFCFQLASGQGRTTQLLRSSPITGPSTLLRAAPPLRLASVLSSLVQLRAADNSYGARDTRPSPALGGRHRGADLSPLGVRRRTIFSETLKIFAVSATV